MELINSIGDDPLLPILAMGGAGQVGAAFAIYFKTKKAKLKRAIAGGLPLGGNKQTENIQKNLVGMD